ncbi:MAG TPA: ATP-binding protein [Kofleriaceae bacterium]|nr:ATP-binding protein [Kofleriaceae bacterium]
MTAPRTRRSAVRLVRLAGLLFLPLGLIAAYVVFRLPDRFNERAVSAARERGHGLADVVASLLAPDLEFEDREHAYAELTHLGVEPGLMTAELFTSTGDLFAAWHAEAAGSEPASPPSPVETTTVRIARGSVEVISPVAAAGGTGGTLRLRFSSRALDAEISENQVTAVTLAAALAVIGLAFSFVTGLFLVRRHAAEEALRRAAESFGHLSDRLPVAVVIYRDQHVLYANPAGEELLGTVGGAAGPASALDTLVGAWGAAIATGSDRLGEHSLVAADGSPFNVEMAAVPIEFQEKEATALVLVDVTERKRLQERLESAGRMISLGTLAAGVAHEINNPLAVVIANVQIVRAMAAELEGGGVTEGTAAEMRECLADVADAAERVRHIVGDMQTLSRSAEELVPVDVDQAMRKALDLTRSHLATRVRVATHLAAPSRVLGSERRLVQIFVNLLTNAAHAATEDASRREGLVEVATGSGPGGTVIVSVRDDGRGIPAAIRERLFDPFFTTKPVGVGTGLGLSIVHNLTAAMRGSIDVASVEGAGATFTLRLQSAGDALTRLDAAPSDALVRVAS